MQTKKFPNPFCRSLLKLFVKFVMDLQNLKLYKLYLLPLDPGFQQKQFQERNSTLVLLFTFWLLTPNTF